MNTTKEKMLSYTLLDSYKQYYRDPDLDLGHRKISRDNYLSLNAAFNQFMMKLVFEGIHVYLPSRCGNVYIEGKKQEVKFDEEGKVKGLAPDWKATKALWARDSQAGKEKKMVYHMNMHTDGVRYKIKFSNNMTTGTYKALYSFKPSRANKRMLPEMIRRGATYKVGASQ